MRKGKAVAQGAHASVAVVLATQHTKETKEWLGGEYTKICVGIKGEKALIKLVNEAERLGIPNKLIQDLGHTEFNGRPTITCCALGPWYDGALDSLTGQLKLL